MPQKVQSRIWQRNCLQAFHAAVHINFENYENKGRPQSFLGDFANFGPCSGQVIAAKQAPKLLSFVTLSTQIISKSQTGTLQTHEGARKYEIEQTDN